MSTILTGLKANNTLHLGNYIGAIKPMSDIQAQMSEKDMLYMFVPDLHTITVPVDYKNLHLKIVENMRMNIAGGVDLNNAQTVMYRQSHVSAHSELAWIFQCFTYHGEAARMTEFKDKAAKEGESFSTGLLTYPMLMAADILLYNADFIPVGDDQKQHIELTKTLAERINSKFGNILKVPKSWKEQLEFANRTESIRIRSLQNPTKKMSKSLKDPKGTINLLDDPSEASKKIMSAETDSVGVINYDFEKQPGISNLLQIEAYLNEREISEVVKEWEGNERYGDLKKTVAATLEEFLTDFQTKYNKINEDDVLGALERGEKEAAKVANETLLKVQKAIGLRR